MLFEPLSYKTPVLEKTPWVFGFRQSQRCYTLAKFQSTLRRYLHRSFLCTFSRYTTIFPFLLDAALQRTNENYTSLVDRHAIAWSCTVMVVRFREIDLIGFVLLGQDLPL